MSGKGYANEIALKKTSGLCLAYGQWSIDDYCDIIITLQVDLHIFVNLWNHPNDFNNININIKQHLLVFVARIFFEK